ncbi:hypothetical protein BJ508DRAFT_367735 [Ascobolus immersus RN42]|uniref:Uncharacterized protein n=1 Tax=Ascobolus immersus RN42 TaxID=1160509 RepID=A0A3N4HAB2_ASCIM|nr:hypothetical protein BJ508DRAFT_367735 [Ascobolus immersus RN42]
MAPTPSDCNSAPSPLNDSGPTTSHANPFWHDFDEIVRATWYNGIPFVSESVHERVIAHFSSYPLELIDPKRAGTALYRDWFIATYETLLESSYHATGYSYAPVFRPVIEEHILFYINHLFPYFLTIDWPYKSPGRTTRDPRYAYWLLIDNLGNHNDDGAEIAVPQRYKARLMRNEQVKLLEAVMRSLHKQLRFILEVKTDNEELRITELGRACLRADNSVEKFLGSANLRSERLEVLLVRYLEQEDVNWEVVRRLDQAQRKKEEENEEWRERLDCSHFFDPNHHWSDYDSEDD